MCATAPAEKVSATRSLSERFFREALRGGVRSFFRIAVGEDGSLISDDQFPEWFKEWKRPN
jgi:hypothetical protein